MRHGRKQQVDVRVGQMQKKDVHFTGSLPWVGEMQFSRELYTCVYLMHEGVRLMLDAY